MVFVIFNDSGIEVFITKKHVIEIYPRGHFLKIEAEQWVEAANKLLETFPHLLSRQVKDIVDQNIMFDYSIPGEEFNCLDDLLDDMNNVYNLPTDEE